MDKEKIKELALDIMFSVNDEETNELEKEFNKLNQMLDVFDSIDTTNVEEMVYPFDEPTSYLRADESLNVSSQDDALSNAKKTKQGHIVVPKVVK